MQEGKSGHVQELQNVSSWIISREEIHMTEHILGRGGWEEVKIISQYNISVFACEMNIAAKVRIIQIYSNS